MPLKVSEKPCIEMRTLARQNSTTSSNEMYTSCMTHLPTSPCAKGHNSYSSYKDTPFRKNIYINPLGESQSFTSLPSKICASSNTKSASRNICDFDQSRGKQADCDSDDVFSGQIVHNMECYKKGKWQRFNSQPPLQGECRYQGNDHAQVLDVQAVERAHGGSLKRHRSENSRERHLHFGDVMERTFSSTDNIHDMQVIPKPKLKFQKAVSLASKLHGSPSTGRKLANYHLIVNPKSGMN